MTGSKGSSRGFRTVTPYLRLQGAAEMIDFLKQAFGATENMRFNRPDGTIMHAQMQIGDSAVELADSDPSPMALHLYVRDADTVYAKAVEAGATGLYAPRDQPYGDREGTVRDRWGNNWYIATHRAGTSYMPEGLGTLTTYLHPKARRSSSIFWSVRWSGGYAAPRLAGGDRGACEAANRRCNRRDGRGPWGVAADAGLLHVYVDDADAWYRRALKPGAQSLSRSQRISPTASEVGRLSIRKGTNGIWPPEPASYRRCDAFRENSRAKSELYRCRPRNHSNPAFSPGQKQPG